MIRISPVARIGLGLIGGFVLVVLYGPLFIAVFFSFFEFQNNAVQWDSFSFDAYVSLFHDESILEAVGNTLFVGAAAVVLSVILGTALAFYYNGSRSRFRELLQLVIFLPFLMPPIITGLSLLIFFREIDVPRSLWTVIIGHTVFVLALVYRIVLTRLQTLRTSLVEASLDLGASHWQTFRYVLLPGLMPAIGSAAILAFALSFDETLITLLVTGTDSTLPMRLWAMMRMGFAPDINALVAVILVGSTLLALFAIRFVKIPMQPN
ncbi:MAG: ABC transporter permease [Bauldia sp.]